MVHTTPHRLFVSIFATLVIFTLLFTIYSFVFAQETPSASEENTATPINPTDDAESVPYELGTILIQYDETLFRTSVNDEGGSTPEAVSYTHLTLPTILLV